MCYAAMAGADRDTARPDVGDRATSLPDTMNSVTQYGVIVSSVPREYIVLPDACMAHLHADTL